MKRIRSAILATIATMTLMGVAATETPKMKMITPIPEGIEIPNKLETHLVTLTSFDGIPDKETLISCAIIEQAESLITA